MTRRSMLMAALAAALAACGRKGPLDPPPEDGDDEEKRDY